MNRTTASILGYTGAVAAAVAASFAMTGTALAESPTIDTTPFVSTRARADVRAEVLGSRLSSAGAEYTLQQSDFKPSGVLSRAQVTAEYIGAREQVHAMNAEHGGSGTFGGMPGRTGTMVAGSGVAR